MIAASAPRHKVQGMTDNEIAKSLRLRALAAATRRTTGNKAISDAKHAEEVYQASVWLVTEIKHRLDVVRRVEDVTEDDGKVAVLDAGIELYASVEDGMSKRRLYAGVSCPLCDEWLSTEVTYLADVGDLLMQAGQHCDGSVC